MSGDLKTGMVTIGTVLLSKYWLILFLLIVKCVRDKSGYFAERLYKSMKVIHVFC